VQFWLIKHEGSRSFWSLRKKVGSQYVFLRCRKSSRTERIEEEALAMAEDAIRLVLDDMVARGEPIPRPTTPRIREVTVTLAA
jgi:phage gp46-like protein